MPSTTITEADSVCDELIPSPLEDSTSFDAPDNKKQIVAESHSPQAQLVTDGEVSKTCLLCDRNFETLSELSLHFVKHGLTDNALVKYGVHMIFCEVCGETFDSADVLEEHYNVKHIDHNEFVWSCDSCNEDFENEVELLVHDSNVHSDSVTPAGNNLQCLLCRKRTIIASKPLLAQHIAVHLMKKYACHLCKKQYCTRAALRLHHKAHNYNYECKVCGNPFATNSSLKGHMQNVHGSNRYICQFCGKIYSRKIGLTQHLHTHSDQKKYACELCPYRAHKGTDLQVRKIKNSINLSK